MCAVREVGRARSEHERRHRGSVNGKASTAGCVAAAAPQCLIMITAPDGAAAGCAWAATAVRVTQTTPPMSSLGGEPDLPPPYWASHSGTPDGDLRKSAIMSNGSTTATSPNGRRPTERRTANGTQPCTRSPLPARLTTSHGSPPPPLTPGRDRNRRPMDVSDPRAGTPTGCAAGGGAGPRPSAYARPGCGSPVRSGRPSPTAVATGRRR